ncbi:hypothetical protein ncot_11900 [Nocardioides sp. JQ2195]|uniref:hypothetical protein n=1 Tax=Nocardioides sp. JQ2195 TaxID=2592334 RepID=UPI00143ED7AC|nr:hypothetical protein [Nocardioides sp. JQ2195]QIX27223.1 hypothetical protein ncot_11900 [Nocardioides sp. JQ2195]
MSNLLDLAEAQLASPGSHGNRMACWLARSALEESIDELLAIKKIEAGERSSTRSKLSCLEVAFEGTGLPSKAQYAWSRLSESCHQHAFKLSPTFSEVEHLIHLVRTIQDHAPNPADSQTPPPTPAG